MHPTSATSARITCPRCAGQNPEIARFCNRCGFDFATSAPSPPQAPAQALAPTSAPSSAPPAALTPLAVTAPPPSASPPPPSPPAQGRKICPGCHTFNAATSAFCADCGVALPRDATIPTFGGPAGFWIRLVAFLIDAVLIAVVEYLLSERLGLPDPDPERMELGRFLLEIAPSIALHLALSSIYAMIMIGTWGGTVGKLILGLRVVRFSDGGKVPYGLALGRSLAEIISGLSLGLGYLWIALTPSKRGWHDYLCDTRVVRARPG